MNCILGTHYIAIDKLETTGKGQFYKDEPILCQCHTRTCGECGHGHQPQDCPEKKPLAISIKAAVSQDYEKMAEQMRAASDSWMFDEPPPHTPCRHIFRPVEYPPAPPLVPTPHEQARDFFFGTPAAEPHPLLRQRDERTAPPAPAKINFDDAAHDRAAWEAGVAHARAVADRIIRGANGGQIVINPKPSPGTPKTGNNGLMTFEEMWELTHPGEPKPGEEDEP